MKAQINSMKTTDRRGFFKVFGVLAAAASVSPTIFIPRFEPVRWKRRSCLMAVPNPAYETAKYEWSCVDMPILFDRKILVGLEVNGRLYPVRGNALDANGKLVDCIPPFILQNRYPKLSC